MHSARLQLECEKPAANRPIRCALEGELSAFPREGDAPERCSLVCEQSTGCVLDGCSDAAPAPAGEPEDALPGVAARRAVPPRTQPLLLTRFLPLILAEDYGRKMAPFILIYLRDFLQGNILETDAADIKMRTLALAAVHEKIVDEVRPAQRTWIHDFRVYYLPQDPARQGMRARWAPIDRVVLFFTEYSRA